MYFVKETTNRVWTIIYKSILQNDYTVIPVNGHRQVISYCKTLNKINFDYKAYGIIDGDMLSKEQKVEYEKDDIFVLPFNEIEMLERLI